MTTMMRNIFTKIKLIKQKQVKYIWNTNLTAILTTFITCFASLSGLFVGKAAKQNTVGKTIVVPNYWVPRHYAKHFTYISLL